MTDDTSPQDAKDPTPPGSRTFAFKRSFTFGQPPPGDDPNVTLVPAPARTFKWEWRGGADEAPADDALPPDAEPATYYEALSGRRDPMRDFFINARRTLNLIVTLTAVAIPVGLVILTIVTGQTLETIVFAGIAGAIVGLMLKSSFPRTPFG